MLYGIALAVYLSTIVKPNRSTCQVNESENIFLEDQDNKEFLKNLLSTYRTCNFSLQVFVCVTDNFHLLVTTPYKIAQS